MRLVPRGQELVNWSEIRIHFECRRPSLAEVICDPFRWCEIQIFEAAIRIIDNRVEEDVPISQVPANDRPDFRTVLRVFPMSRVEAEFEIHRIYKGLIRGIGLSKELTQFPAIVNQPHIAGVAVEREIETLLEPWRYAISPFRHGVVGAVWDKAAGERRLLRT